jgi:integrase
VTAATVNREFAFLRRVYNIAIRDDKTTRNPVSKLKALREPSGRVRYLSDDEETTLLKALPADEDRDRVTVLLQTGFRRGELLGLRWRDVDFKAGVLTIPKSKNGDIRHVPMTSTVRGILSHRARPRTLLPSCSRTRRATVTFGGPRKRSLRPCAPLESKISGSTTFGIASRAALPWRAWT